MQARGVGGNGILSSMVYMRALPSDIEAWGLPSWGWERMLGLYKDLEHYAGHNDQAGVHGSCSSSGDDLIAEGAGREGVLREVPLRCAASRVGREGQLRPSVGEGEG